MDCAKYDAFAKWIDAHPEKLKMPRSEFDALLDKAKQPKTGTQRRGSRYRALGHSSWNESLAAFRNQRRLQHRLGIGNVVKVAGVAAAAGIAVNRPARAVIVQARGDVPDKSRACTSP